MDAAKVTVTASEGVPLLPAGYSIQGAWGFRADSSFYEFFRAYGPAEDAGACGDICRLDEQRSYWLALPVASEATSQHRAVGRALSYAQAPGRFGRKVSFDEFGSVLKMRDLLPGLMLPAG